MSADRPGTVTFVQHHVPALDAGEYLVTVAQEVTLRGAAPLRETFVAQARFAVRGERFALDPLLVDSVFPPPGSEGDHAQVLPHIVLKRRSLPWERTPLAVPPTAAEMAANGAPSWLALLVFDEGEAPPVATVTVADLVAAADAPAGRRPAGILSYPGLADLDFGESFSDACTVIDLPVALFQAVAPSLADLAWLAHARIVAAERKARSGDGAAGDTDYAVVVANRLPVPDRRSTVHLVSLEGLGAILPAGDGTAGAVPAGVDAIRLVTLRNWSFAALGGRQGFSACFERLDCAPLRLPQDAAAPAAGADAIVAGALTMGYGAFDHGLRGGGTTVSWYRGPLVPHPTARRAATPIPSGDAVTRYDPATGMFDVTDAVAWQIGRLLALADRPFAAALYRWKLAHRHDAVLAAEQAVLARRLGDGGGGGARQTALRALTLQLAGAPAGETPAAPEDPAAPALPALVIDRLARWRRLEGVPLRLLVPDAAMLPPESIRFFHLDLGWVDCLADGAYSLGRSTEGDLARDATTGGAVHDAAHAAATAQGAEAVITGFLLRSAALTHWPGTEIEPRDAAGGLLPTLRFDRLAPDLVICLLDGALAEVVFHQPPEGLHFGLDLTISDHVDHLTFVKRLRPAPGLAPPPVGVSFRAGRVVRIADLAQTLKSAAGAPVFTAAEFALQMVEGVGRVRFAVDTAAAGRP